jgi:hypothetical protein
MNLSAPKQVTWIIAVIIGLAGILENMGSLSVPSFSAFTLVAIGFGLLAIATLFKGI